MNQTANRLLKEKSPYLLQHAYNPVDWYPWGEEAFEKARREDKPVFLSIGYSTCHWCHVMEHESFEDEEIAALLNKQYVAVKVDREERPDVDSIYMSVCQAITGQGGWPLTVILTPEKKAFFVGTYFPKRNTRGRMGLLELLIRIGEAWQYEREDLLGTAENIMTAVQKGLAGREGGEEEELSGKMAEEGYLQLSRSFDAEFGGFGRSPKFPMAHNLMFLLRYWQRCRQPQALEMVEKTLKAMAQGGIYDHLGYGFARYSTDRQWLAPHFEKMLYDNALLCQCYLEAYQCTGNVEFRNISEEILNYVLRDMTDPEGGFYSAEDADSEGVEGKYYVFTLEEIMTVLGEEQGKQFADCYDVSPQGNFEGHAILNRIGRDLDKDAKRWGKTSAELAAELKNAREKLLTLRQTRIPPLKDDKVLTAWNGLMIAALAKAGRVLGEKRYTKAAQRSLEFMEQKLRRSDGRLLARYREGEAAYPAYLDDYAFLLQAYLEIYQTVFDREYITRAAALAADMRRLFWDEAAGGFYFYGSDSEQLPVRPKETYDGALPSGNSVAALALQQLADYWEDDGLQDMARRQLAFCAKSAGRQPGVCCYFLIALEYFLAGQRRAVIIGEHGKDDTQALLTVLQQQFLPGWLIDYHSPDGAQGEYKMVDGQAAAYLCYNFTCQPPLTQPEALQQVLADA